MGFDLTGSRLRGMTGLAVLGLVWGTGHAADPASGSASAGSLEEVVVSGRLIGEVRADLLGSSVTVLSEQDMENRQTRVVSDVLRDVPGVAVSRSGAVGSITQVRMRGAESNHTLVFVDGIKASDPYFGEFDFGTLFADDAARIEILRGEQSALYGSDAIGGVISYTTSSGKDSPGVRGYLEAGSFRTGEAAVRVAGVSGALDYAVSGHVLTIGGTPTARDGVRDVGARSTNGAGKFTWTLSDQLSLRAVVRSDWIHADTDPQDFNFPPGPTYGYAIDGNDSYVNKSLSGLLGADFNSADERWKSSASVQGVNVERNGYGGSGYGSEQVTNGDQGRRARASYVTSYDFGDPTLKHTVTGAVDYEREQYQNTDPSGYADTSTRSTATTGVVAQYDLSWNDRLGLGGAIRQNHNDRFKDGTTYRVQATYRFNGGFRPRAAAGTGVKAPGIYELYGYTTGANAYIGNSNLKPEKSKGWEAGFDQAIGDVALIAATYFDSNLNDEIYTIYTNFGATASPANRATASTRRGVEFSTALRLAKSLRLDVAYTHLTSEENGRQEMRRPENIGSVNLDYRGRDDAWGANLTVRYNGDQTDNNFTLTGPSVVTLPSYTLVNLGADFRLNQSLRLYARVENALDKEYEEVYTFASPGRAAYVGVRGRF